MRCLKCGSSKVDFEYSKCLLCGAAAGLRDEQCYVTIATKKILFAHTEKLAMLGVTLEKQEVIQKSYLPPGTIGFQIDPIGAASLVLAIEEALNPGGLRRLVLFLWNLKLPKDEILCLRLAEPETIAEILNDKEKGSDTAK